jgi:hypothetical protein
LSLRDGLSQQPSSVAVRDEGGPKCVPGQ